MSALADDALDLLTRLDDLGPDDLDASELARLRALHRRVGFLSVLTADRAAFELSTTAELEEPRSRTQAEKAIKEALRARPWRGKVVARAEGRWTIQAKMYTAAGTVCVYASSLADLLRLVDAVEEPLAPLRQWPDEEAA